MASGDKAKPFSLLVAVVGGHFQQCLSDRWTWAAHLDCEALQGDNGDLSLSGIAAEGGADLGFSIFNNEYIGKQGFHPGNALIVFGGLAAQYAALSGHEKITAPFSSVNLNYKALNLVVRSGLQSQISFNSTWFLNPAAFASLRLSNETFTSKSTAPRNSTSQSVTDFVLVLRLDTGYRFEEGLSDRQWKAGIGLALAPGSYSIQGGVEFDLF